MTDEKYIVNQKNYIRRELREIILSYAKVSIIPLIMIAAIVIIIFSRQVPGNWAETSFTLSDFFVVRHHHSVTLELIAEDGRHFTVINKASKLTPVLEKGEHYTVVYADNLFRNTVTKMIISGQEYISLADSIKAYHSNNIMFLVFILLITLLLTAGNIIVWLSLKPNVRRVKKYLRRIKTRSGSNK